MTIQDLSRLYYLRREIDTLRELRTEEFCRATGTVYTITGAPRAPGRSDKVAAGAARLADIDRKIEALRRQCSEEAARLIDFIRSCEDSRIRLIMELRFLKCQTWQRVALTVGGGNSPEGCIMAVKRYLDQINEREKRAP